MIKLFLDDERYPPNDNSEWIIVRSFYDAICYVKEHGIPEFISWDHDLGYGPSGYDFALWLIDQHLDGTHLFPEGFSFFVHSMNPIGAENIRKLLNNFLESR